MPLTIAARWNTDDVVASIVSCNTAGFAMSAATVRTRGIVVALRLNDVEEDDLGDRVLFSVGGGHRAAIQKRAREAAAEESGAAGDDDLHSA